MGMWLAYIIAAERVGARPRHHHQRFSKISNPSKICLLLHFWTECLHVIAIANFPQ